jgi:hypothetical protein
MTKPTVSQLISLLDKPNLLKWANKIGLEGVKLEDYRKQSTGDGDNVHKQIENDLKHGIPFDNPQFQAFRNRYTVEQIEPVIECEHYRGRADVVMKRDNLLYLFDFKNANSIYFEQKLQLVAYKRVLKVDKVGIVNTTYFTENIVEMTAEQEAAYTRILSALVIIWNAKQILGQ